MNNSTNHQVELMRLAQSISEEDKKTLKRLFKDKIKGSFLIKIEHKVMDRMGLALFDYYPIQADNRRIVTGTDETPRYDICRMIVGVHRHHSIFLSEQEISNNQRNEEYQEQLVKEVVEKIRLRQFGSVFFRKKQLLSGDEFLYFPVPYELFVMCMRAIYLMPANADPLFRYYIDIINNALSTLTLMENNFLSNAYPLCRGMIEQYLKVLVLKKHPEIREEYSRFCEFEIEQSCCSQKYPDEFIQLYNKRVLPTARSRTNYLHYGWLDGITSYTTRKSARYSIYGILDFLMDGADKRQYAMLDGIKVLYKMCHGYAHGSAVHAKYPLLQYFEISFMLYYVIESVFMDIHRMQGAALRPGDKELLEMLDRDYGILQEQYKKRSSENFELYYRIHR